MTSVLLISQTKIETDAISRKLFIVKKLIDYYNHTVSDFLMECVLFTALNVEEMSVLTA